MLECCNDILAESGCKNILLCTKLVPGLSDDGVDDIQPRNFVFRFALFPGNKTEGGRENKALLRAALVLTEAENEDFGLIKCLTFCMNFSTLWTTCL